MAFVISGHEAILLSALVFALGVAMPLLLSLPTNDLYDDLAASTISTIFTQAVLIAISLSVPMIVDALLDVRLPQHLTFPRGMLLFAQIVPNAILYTNAYSTYYNRVAVFFSVMHIREVLMFGAMLGYYVGGTTSWDKTAISLIMMVVFGLAMNVHNASIYVNCYAVLVERIGVAVSGFSVLGVIVMCLYRLVRWWYHLDPYEPYTAIYVHCLLFSHLIKWGIYISMGAGIVYRRAGLYYACIPVVDGVVAIIAAILPGRMARQELLQAQDLLEAKRNFVRHISHEMRTPLNTVFMGIQLATQEISSLEGCEEVLDIINSVYTSCSVSIEILNDMLLFDRLEHQGDVDMHFQTADMSQLVDTIAKTFIIQAIQSNINYQINSNVTPPISIARQTLVRMDVHKMGQVIRNLISNALKFTPERGRVNVTLRQVDDLPRTPAIASSLAEEEYEGNVRCPLHSIVPKVRLDVEDTGPGISKEDQMKLFHNIVQFHAAELQGGKGSGLGLWISKHIIDAHGGEIGVESEGEGQGSLFYIELPLYTGLENKSDEDILIADYSHDHHRRFSPKSPHDVTYFEFLRVLIVDDSAYNRKMLHAALDNFFHEVYEASNGVEAIDCVRSQKMIQHTIDVIFMDSIMPVMGGLETCRLLRSEEIRYNGKIIGVTGNVLGGAVTEFIKAGADIVLPKPLLLDEIYNSLCTMLPEHKLFFEHTTR